MCGQTVTRKKKPNPVKDVEEILKKEDQAVEKISADQENFVEKDLQDAKRVTGRRSTILTGPRGISGGSGAIKKTLLGE